jgi:hypothetical protein
VVHGLDGRIRLGGFSQAWIWIKGKREAAAAHRDDVRREQLRVEELPAQPR